MKKQILTLTMCLALSATAPLASDAATVAKKTPAKVTVNEVKTQEPTLTPEQAAKKHFEEKMTKEKEDFYCKLGLSAEQKAKAESLDKRNRAEAEPLFQKVRAEKIKLHELNAQKASETEICKQKHQVKVAKKALKAHFEASKKAFDAILTKEQLEKAKALHEEHKAKMKEHCKCKCHNHHDFDGTEGMPPKCPCKCGAHGHHCSEKHHFGPDLEDEHAPNVPASESAKTAK